MNPFLKLVMAGFNFAGAALSAGVAFENLLTSYKEYQLFRQYQEHTQIYGLGNQNFPMVPMLDDDIETWEDQFKTQEKF